MLEIKHQSVMSESGEVTAVIIDIDTFKKIEAIIEDYGLLHFMQEAESSEVMGRDEAEQYLQSLEGSS